MLLNKKKLINKINFFMVGWIRACTSLPEMLSNHAEFFYDIWRPTFLICSNCFSIKNERLCFKYK